MRCRDGLIPRRRPCRLRRGLVNRLARSRLRDLKCPFRRLQRIDGLMLALTPDLAARKPVPHAHGLIQRILQSPVILPLPAPLRRITPATETPGFVNRDDANVHVRTTFVPMQRRRVPPARETFTSPAPIVLKTLRALLAAVSSRFPPACHAQLRRLPRRMCAQDPGDAFGRYIGRLSLRYRPRKPLSASHGRIVVGRHGAGVQARAGVRGAGGGPGEGRTVRRAHSGAGAADRGAGAGAGPGRRGGVASTPAPRRLARGPAPPVRSPRRSRSRDSSRPSPGGPGACPRSPVTAPRTAGAGSFRERTRYGSRGGRPPTPAPARVGREGSGRRGRRRKTMHEASPAGRSSEEGRRPGGCSLSLDRSR